MPEILLIANPKSGGGRGIKMGEELVRKICGKGVKAELVFSENPDDGARIAHEAIEEGCRKIGVCGGDGTINGLLGALADTPAAIGIVPCGRGNDFARVFKIPTGIDELASMFIDGREQCIDMGRIGDRYFCTVACMGFDSEAAELVYRNKVPFSGTAAYILAVFKTLIAYRSPEIRLTGDFGTFEGSVLLTATGNTTTYGGGMKVVPKAVCDDGLLDVCIIGTLSRLNILRYFPRIFSGTHDTLSFVEMKRTRNLTIETSRPIWIYADGEPFCQTPVTIGLAEKALRVILPKNQEI